MFPSSAIATPHDVQPLSRRFCTGDVLRRGANRGRSGPPRLTVTTNRPRARSMACVSGAANGACPSAPYTGQRCCFARSKSPGPRPATDLRRGRGPSRAERRLLCIAQSRSLHAPPQLLVPLGDRALPIRFVAIPRPKPDEQCAASWPGHHSSSAHARSSEERPVIAKHHRPFFDKRQYALHPLLCVGGVVATSFVFPVLLRDYRDGVWKTARLSMLTACRYEMGRHRGKLSIPKTPPCRGAPRPFFAFVPNSGRTETGSLPGFASPCVDAQG